jgi:predicted nucleic acid-binding protein
MILIADSSALIALAIVNKLKLLESIFGEVYVPQAVYIEISKQDKIESQQLINFCKDKVLNIQTNINLNITLGQGESESIILYKEIKADYFLCDDKKAKKFAKNFGVNVIGSLGILLKAKEKNLIEEINPLLNKLKTSKIFIDDKTYLYVLKIAKE